MNNIRNNNKLIDNRVIYYYFLLAFPIIDVLAFFMNTFFDYKIIIGTAHIVYLGMLLFLFYVKNIKDRVIILIFILYPFMYSIGQGEQFYRALRETTLFIGFPALFFVLSRYDFNFHILKARKTILYFSIIFISLYIISVFYSEILTVKTPLYEMGIDSRIYYNGFIIAHSFGYYSAIIAIYFLIERRTILALVFIIATLIQGARAPMLGLIVLLVFTWKYYIPSFNKNTFIKIISIAIMLITTIIILYYTNDTIYYNINSILMVFYKGNEADLVKISTGRTALLENGIDEIINNFNLRELIFGRGATASGEFTSLFKGYYSWFHCDQIQILFNFGILGILLYFVPLIKYSYKHQAWPLFVFIIIVGFTNGFYLYDYYPLVMIYYLLKKNITLRR